MTVNHEDSTYDQPSPTTHAIITRQTFIDFGFRDPTPGRWTVMWHSNLKRFPQYQKSILLGICEWLVGAVAYKMDKGRHYDWIELPHDFGQYGFVDCDIEYNRKSVFVRNLFTSQQPPVLLKPIVEG
jgi:hypothetical protein